MSTYSSTITQAHPVLGSRVPQVFNIPGTEDPEDLASEAIDVLNRVSKRLAEAAMKKPYLKLSGTKSATQSWTKDSEKFFGYEESNWAEYEGPETATLRKGIKVKLSAYVKEVVQAVSKNRWLRDVKPQDVEAALLSKEGLQYLASTLGGEDLKDFIDLHESLSEDGRPFEEALYSEVYDSMDTYTDSTVTTEDGKEHQSNGLPAKFAASMYLSGSSLERRIDKNFLYLTVETQYAISYDILLPSDRRYDDYM